MSKTNSMQDRVNALVPNDGDSRMVLWMKRRRSDRLFREALRAANKVDIRGNVSISIWLGGATGPEFQDYLIVAGHVRKNSSIFISE